MRGSLVPRHKLDGPADPPSAADAPRPTGCHYYENPPADCLCRHCSPWVYILTGPAPLPPEPKR